MAKSQKYIGCSIKTLPDKELYAAAKFAMKINPANRAAVESFAVLGIDPDKYAISVLASKYWGAEGVNLSVGFMSRASAALQEKIVSHFNAWGEYCNVKFTITGGAVNNAQIRISLGGSGYWSFLGTDVLRIRSGEPTMNLQGFSLNTSEAEYQRVVRHEIGHTMAAPHEHMRRAIVNRLDEQKTIAYFMRTQGWSADEVRQQVLTPLEESSILGTPTAEDTSLMCYGLPASITKDGKAIPGGMDITKSDGLFMNKLYPKPLPPSPPPAGTHTVTFVFTSPPVAGTYSATLQSDGPPPTP